MKLIPGKLYKSIRTIKFFIKMKSPKDFHASNYEHLKLLKNTIVLFLNQHEDPKDNVYIWHSFLYKGIILWDYCVKDYDYIIEIKQVNP